MSYQESLRDCSWIGVFCPKNFFDRCLVRAKAEELARWNDEEGLIELAEVLCPLELATQRRFGKSYQTEAELRL